MAHEFSGAAGGEKPRVIPANLLGSFVLITFLFALWGFANDITNPMVAAFKNILLISNFESSLVQFAFYGGYCVMAIPAAIFIKRFSYKTGILVGLALYAIGCLLFIPSGWMMAFWAFLISYFVMTCGLSFLETSSNPYILALGPEETSTRRLNFAQSFNPMGSIVGMLIASQVILVSLNTTTETGRRYLEKVGQGELLHVLLHKDSLESVNKARTALTSVGEGVQDAKKLKLIADSLQNARKALQPLDGEREALAVQFKHDLDLARKEAPRIVTKVLMLVKANPEAEAAQQAFEQQRDRLKSLFEADRSLLDLTVQASLENQELATRHPAVLDAAKPLMASALKTITETCNRFETAAQNPEKASEPGHNAELMAELDRCLQAIAAASAPFEAISAASMADWYLNSNNRLAQIRKTDLDVIIGPYTILGGVVLVCLIVFGLARLPKVKGEEDNTLNLGPTFKRLFGNAKYLEGVVAQAFYVGAQIMCWTFIVQYGENELGMDKAVAQNYNIVAMTIFVSSRFVCTALLKYFSPGGLLMSLAIGGFALVLGTIFVQGMTGMYCLVGVSACMSLMFPTIYGIALKGLGDDAKLGAAGLIMAIGGGCLMPPMQGAIMDMDPFTLGSLTLSSTRASFVLPLICFVVIALYGFRTSNVHRHTN